MEFKGTKGEWTLHVNLSYPEVRVLDYGNRIFGAAVMLHKDENDVLVDAHHSDENIANAKLIADAPLMLKYLIRQAEKGCKEAKDIIEKHVG